MSFLSITEFFVSYRVLLIIQYAVVPVSHAWKVKVCNLINENHQASIGKTSVARIHALAQPNVPAGYGGLRGWSPQEKISRP